MPRTRRKATRRDELIAAALRCFGASGVAGTSVDDIVREAGVAKGTFYLYFTTKDEVVTAVAERLVERIGADMDAGLRDPSRSPAERIAGIPGAMSLVTADSLEAALVDEIHRPENAPIHDRLAATIIARLLPGVTAAVEQGIADGDFADQEPHRAASFVLAAMTAIDSLVHDPADLEPALRDVQVFVLRGLGHEETPR
jgi:AcrR family transcriptional regulator